MGVGPIFLGGLSFTGKTPLRLMLSAHPNIVLTRRTRMWTRYYNHYGDLSLPDNFERCLAAMLRNKHIAALQPDEQRIRREFRQGEPTYARLFELFQEHFMQRVGKSRWGDQLGFVERYVDPIFTAYPHAKLIHMVRDQRERYAEATPPTRRRSGKFGWDTARWLESVRLARRNQQRYPDRYLVVRYENLIEDTEATLRAICDFLDERFVPQMLTMEDAISFGDRDGVLTLAPASCVSISAGERLFTTLHAGRDLLAFGYQMPPATLTTRERLRFFAVDWPANLAGMVAWRTLETTPLARH